MCASVFATHHALDIDLVLRHPGAYSISCEIIKIDRLTYGRRRS
jgi:hypothetical protein